MHAFYHIGRSIILGTGPRDRPRDPRTSELRGRSSCACAPRRFVVVVSCVVRIYMHDAARHSARTAARKLTAMGFLWHVFSTPSPTNCEAEPGAITHAITCTAKKKPWPRSIIACRRSKTAKFAMQRCTRVPRDVDASVDDASREADRANSSIRTTLLDGGTVLLLQH
jgi:hypothetical protein